MADLIGDPSAAALSERSTLPCANAPRRRGLVFETREEAFCCILYAVSVTGGE